MADILIRGLSLPESGFLNIEIAADGSIWKKFDGLLDATAIELPPHGDLVSKDDVMNAILGEPPEAHYPSWYASIVNEIPAIVPSNKEDSRTMDEFMCGQECGNPEGGSL